MDIPINAKVSCLDGPCGQSMLVILKPTTQEITHFVVSNQSIPETEYLVSIDHIAESTPDNIRLNCSLEELTQMPIFARSEFVPSDLIGFSGSSAMMWPYYVPLTAYITPEQEHIPAGELAIRRGAGVEASDGHAGRVDEFLINPTNDHISHLVMREGHLWGRKDVTIPVSQIDHFADNVVYLKLSKQEIEKLPSIPVHRNRAKTDQSD
jgi:sporulation protein YlmC with PRC-barrel domain